MNFKRKRHKGARSGCLMCKPNKMSHWNDERTAGSSKPGGMRGARNLTKFKLELMDLQT